MTHHNVFQPRSRNGWHDDGKAITSGERCPNCGSTAYRQTLSTESCSSCGLQFSYWGSGGNAVYQNYLDRKEAEERYAEIRHQAEAERQERLRDCSDGPDY